MNAALNLHNVSLFSSEYHHVSWFYVCLCSLLLFPPQRVLSVVYVAILLYSCITSPGASVPDLSNVCVCVCVLLRGEAILLPALPIPSISEREPKDARPECPPYAFRQQPVPRHTELATEPGGARSAGCQTPTNATTTTTITISSGCTVIWFWGPD